MKSVRPASAEMMPRRSRYVQILLLLCAVCHLTLAFPTQTPPSYAEVRQLQVNIPHSGPVLAPLGSSISMPCLVSLSSIPTSTSSTPVVPRVKWTVVSGGVETQILVARGQRVKINEAYRDRAALLNYTSSPDDLSLWLGDLRKSDSGHYRCQVQQGLEDASDLIQLKVRGVVFHYRDAFGRYAFSFQQAKRACEAIGAQIATPDQLLAAYNDGYEQCDAGWLADQSVRYPIQVPREACYGDMDGQPGVRNYGTMDAENLFDVYCYIEQTDGEVFHDSVPQHLSFDEAQSYCRASGAELATTAQLYSAWSEGLDHCSPGWLSDGSVRYPIINPRERCGGSQAGVKTVYRFSNQTGFPEPSSLHDVYCFKENGKISSDSPMDYMTTEAEDIGQNVVILMATDQEVQLNQEAEQVEREAQSILESLPFFSVLFTSKTSADTTPTVISDITKSSFSATSAVDHLHRFDETSEMSRAPHPAAVNSTISSTETYNPIQNTSYLPSVYNETESHQNLSYTFQFGLERTTSEPHTQNQTVLDTNLQETTQPSEKLKKLQDIQETSLNFSRTQANYSETDRNHTQDAGFWEATTLSIDPMPQVKLDEAAVENPLQKPLTTQTSKEEGTTPTQAARTVESTTEASTSLWVDMDGSGDISKEKDLEVDGVTFLSSSPSSTASFMTHPYPSAMASRDPATHQTEAPDPTLLSGSDHLEKVDLDNSTVPQFWESSISRQEGSTSLEMEDTLIMESEEKQLHATQSVDQVVSEASFTISESPEGLNNSYSQTEFPTAQSKTSGYRVYLDTVTSSYEEASAFEPETVSSTFRDDIQVAPTINNETIVFPVIEKEANVSVSLEKEVEIAPTVFLEEESKVESTYAEETETAPTPVFQEEAKVVPTLVFGHEAEATPTLVVEEEAKVAPTFVSKEEARAAPSLVVVEEAKVAPTFVSKEEARAAPSLVVVEEVKVAPTHVFEEAKFDQTLDHKEDANASTPLVPEGEGKIAPVLDYEEEANGATSFEDFTISPSDFQTSKWALLTTTTGPQMALKEVEFSQKMSSTAASHSSTKPTAAAAGKTSTTTFTTTTHWSRRTWSPTTTSPKVFHKTAEPQKVNHVIPPLDHGLADVEISLTQPPTLLILPNERAAVGGTGKSSDACMDSPCLNGGTCTEWNGEIKCLCLPSYGGDFCQTDLERCEPGWDKFQGFCYRHSSQRQSWEVAEQHCRMMGAHLVSIMNPEEQDYINSNYKEYQWTGLNDKMIEDDFCWSDGNPLLYENWYRGQPDSYFLSGEDCVVMVWHDNGRWSDVPCNYHLAYTCKKGTSSCGPPPKVRNASMFGKVRQRYETNAIVRYHCAEGFQQRRNPLIRCQSGGRWERPQILCIPEAEAPVQFPDVTSQTDSNFAAAENEFEATEETPLYREIKF